MSSHESAPPQPIDPLALSRLIQERYHNRSLAKINDHQIRMSVMTEPYRWHHHPDTDETFCCVDGELIIEFAGGEVVVRPGELLTVPAGISHRTRPAGARSVNLTFERIGATTVFDD